MMRRRMARLRRRLVQVYPGPGIRLEPLAAGRPSPGNDSIMMQQMQRSVTLYYSSDCVPQAGRYHYRSISTTSSTPKVNGTKIPVQLWTFGTEMGSRCALSSRATITEEERTGGIPNSFPFFVPLSLPFASGQVLAVLSQYVSGSFPHIVLRSRSALLDTDFAHAMASGCGGNDRPGCLAHALPISKRPKPRLFALAC
eukprot:206220-Rhodomonas_salina.2